MAIATFLCLVALVIVIIAVKLKLIRLRNAQFGPIRLSFNQSASSATTTTLTRAAPGPIVYGSEVHDTVVDFHPKLHSTVLEDESINSPISSRLRPRK